MNFKSLSDLETFIILNHLFVGKCRKVVECLRTGMRGQEILQRIVENNFLRKQDKLIWLEKCFVSAKEIERCQKLGITIHTLFDESYPSLLKETYDPPLILYVKGQMQKFEQPSVAIVGSRLPSLYGMTQARLLSQGLAEAGISIVSGLAKGIDGLAHEAALDVPYGHSLGILGCGLDRVYPREHKRLFDRMIEKGCLVSEFPLGTAPLSHNFPYRNRIISGLSLGVLVVEAHIRSGSLITAREALEQNREVFAVPGEVGRLTSKGTNQLLREGAHFVESAQDVLVELSPQLEKFRNHVARDEIQNDVAELPSKSRIPQELRNNPMTYGEILEKKLISKADASEILLQWELENRVQRAVDGRYYVNHSSDC